MPDKIINFEPGFETPVFQLVCSECCSPLQVRWDRCGLAFVGECECLAQDREDLKADVEDLEDSVHDLEEKVESKGTEIEELEKKLESFTSIQI